MRKGPRLISVLLLLGWLFAVGHVALDHGGVADGGAAHAHADGANDDDHDDDGPAHDGDHHHDLTALTAGQFAKETEHKALAPVSGPLSIAFVERFTAMVRDADESLGNFNSGNAPPDARASGWLLVCQTARPVRGPSLV